MSSPRSALDGLQSFTWSLTDSVDYEVALDTIGYVIAALTALVDQEEKRPRPDLEAIARWEDSITAAVRDQQALRAVDVDAIGEVTTRYREIRAQLDTQFDD
jgi:hypothetical protein